MEDYKVDWTLRGPELMRQLDEYWRNRVLQNIERVDKIVDQLKNQDIFNHQEFKSIRSRLGSQQDWAELVGVSQATIGNYERNLTYPNKGIRKSILNALIQLRQKETNKLTRSKNRTFDVDAVEAKQALDGGILNAALTDFRFDADEQRIVSVPFSSDEATSEIGEIEQDRKDLLAALLSQAEDLSIALSVGANANIVRMVEALRNYRDEVARERPNPRKLFRLGANINRASANDDISFAIKEWDKQSLDGFNLDHNELMRLYYREALAKAQQVDAALIPEGAELPEASEFIKIADMIGSATDEDGEKVFDTDVTTLLRDMARDIAENKEAEVIATNTETKNALRRRRVEAIKNASILVGRFLILSAFFVAVDPLVAVNTAGSIATVLGLIEQTSPGTVRKYYDKLREMLPFLPRFPDHK